MEKTLMIIKPDAVRKKVVGKILTTIESNDFDILEMKMFTMSEEFAETFYKMHKGKVFYEGLIKFITSGRCIMAVLEKENAITDLRRLTGATDSREAEAGTIRNEFGTDNQKNAVHASDSSESAEREINLFHQIN